MCLVRILTMHYAELISVLVRDYKGDGYTPLHIN